MIGPVSRDIPPRTVMSCWREGPTPLREDQEIAELHVEGIETALSATVSDADTGVVLMNHALYDHTETYDPKINDTIIANENIEALLLARHPQMDPDNIVGAFGGAKEVNAESGLFEFTREQRGDRFGTAFLYEGEKQLPATNGAIATGKHWST